MKKMPPSLILNIYLEDLYSNINMLNSNLNRN